MRCACVSRSAAVCPFGLGAGGCLTGGLLTAAVPDLPDGGAFTLTGGGPCGQLGVAEDSNAARFASGGDLVGAPPLSAFTVLLSRVWELSLGGERTLLVGANEAAVRARG